MEKVLNVKRKGIYGKAPFTPVDDISSIRDMIDNSFKKFADRVAYLVKDDMKSPYREIKYKELEEDVHALGTYFIKKGLENKKIAVIGENRYEWAITYLATVCGVGTIVPMDKEIPENEIQYIIDFAEVDAIVFSEKVRKKNESVFENFPGFKINMDLDMKNIIAEGKEFLKEKDLFAETTVDTNDVDIILFTSGTTGKAKGVMLSHKNIANNMMNMCSMVNIKKSDRFFSLLPIHHTYECTCGFLVPLYRGASIAFCQGLKYIVKNMQECHPTVILAVPLVGESMYRQIMRAIKKQGKEKLIKVMSKLCNVLLKIGIDVRRKVFKQVLDNLGGELRLFVMGAAAVDPEVSQGFRNFGIVSIQGYGLTECAPIGALNRDMYYRDDSIGMPLPESEMKIDNPDEDGIGEILIKGDNVMQGYYKNEEATEEVMKDGWFCSGDLGYEKDGFFYITGRKKYVIITANGKNVFPEEVELYLSKEDIVAECMVYGKKDNKGNDSIVAAHIFPDYAYAEEVLGKDFTEEALTKYIGDRIKEVNTKMPSYKAITDFDVREEEFVKTTTKKIKRFAN